MWTDATTGMLRARAQLTARCALKSGLEIWTTLGANAARSRRTDGVRPKPRDIPGGRGSATDGTADQIAGRREGGIIDHRRIDSDAGALLEQIADQAVERLVRAVAHIIVIARKEGDSKVARLHGGWTHKRPRCKRQTGRGCGRAAQAGPAAGRAQRCQAVPARQPARRRVAVRARNIMRIRAITSGSWSARCVDEDLAALDYPQRLQRLQERRIGLWDVIGSASRRGSLDQSIRDAAHNPLADYLAGFPDLQAVGLQRRDRRDDRPPPSLRRPAWTDRPAVLQPGQHPAVRREAGDLAGFARDFSDRPCTHRQSRHIAPMSDVEEERQRFPPVDGRRGVGRRAISPTPTGCW